MHFVEDAINILFVPVLLEFSELRLIKIVCTTFNMINGHLSQWILIYSPLIRMTVPFNNPYFAFDWQPEGEKFNRNKTFWPYNTQK